MISFLLLDLAVMFANCGAWKIIQSNNPNNKLLELYEACGIDTDSFKKDLTFSDLIFLLIPGINIILLISFFIIIFSESKIK